MNREGTFSLEEIKEEIILDKINAKYNFRIQPANITNQCEVKNVIRKKIYIKFVYPLVLNYNLYDDINIYIYWDLNPFYNIILNPSSGKMKKCKSLGSGINRCTISKSYYDGKKNGYYPIFYLNYLNNITQAY